MRKLAMLLVVSLSLQLVMPISVYGTEQAERSSEKQQAEIVEDEPEQTKETIEYEGEPNSGTKTEIREDVEQKNGDDKEEENATVRENEPEQEECTERKEEPETETQKSSEQETVDYKEEVVSEDESDDIQENVFDMDGSTEIEGFIQEKYYRVENGYPLFIGVAMQEWDESITEITNVAYQLDGGTLTKLGTVLSDKFSYNKPTWYEYGGCLTLSLDSVLSDADEGSHALTVWFTVGEKDYKVAGTTEFIDEMSNVECSLDFGKYISCKKGSDVMIRVGGSAFDTSEKLTRFQLVASGTSNIIIEGLFSDAHTYSDRDYRYSYHYDGGRYYLDARMVPKVYKMFASTYGTTLENNINDGYYDVLFFTSKSRELKAEKAVYASAKPIISHVLVENGRYCGLNSDNTGDYVSVVVYGLNLDNNNIPTFYSLSDNAVLANYIDNAPKCGYDLGSTQSLFRLRKSKSDILIGETVRCYVKIKGDDVIYVNGGEHSETTIEAEDCTGIFLGEYLKYGSQGIFKLYIGEGIGCDPGDIITCKMSAQNEYVEIATVKRNKNGKYIEFGKESDIYNNFSKYNYFELIKNGTVLTESTSYYWCYDDISFNWNLEIPVDGSWEIRPLGELIKIYNGKNTSGSVTQLSLNTSQLHELGQYSTVEIRIYDANGKICKTERVYFPETSGGGFDTEDETIKQLVETGSSIFQFVDEMTGAPITNGRVCIEEEFSGTHYYKTNNDGRVNIPLSKDCKRVFVSTSFKGYKNLGGWTDLSYYRSESGAYVFRIEPSPDKYNPNLPSINTTVQTSAPPVETTDGDLNMFDMDMGFSLNFGKGLNFERTYDKNERTVKVAFSTEGKVSYDVIEEEYKASGYKSGKTLDEEFENAEDKMQPGKLCNVDVKTIVKGYLKCDEKGDLIEGGAIVAIKGEGNGEYRPAFAAGVAYGKFKLGLTTEGTLKFVYSDGNLNSSGIIKYEPYATLAVGVGWKLAHAEVGANGKFPIKMTIPYKSDKESLKIDSVFEIYGETVLFCFGGKHTWKTEWNIYPGTNSTRNTNLKEFNSVLRPDYLEVLPRNYLSSNSKVGINTYNASKASGLTSSDSFRYSEISADAGVFKENNVQYVRLSDGTEVLAWIHDFGDKSAVNRTTLVYSINKNDGKGWGSITPVCSDTSTGDYYPNMVSEGNKAYLVWNKASKVFDDDVKTEDVCKNMDVYVSIFESDKFSEPQRISESGNALMEFSPLAAVDGENIAVAWLINSENDYHYTKGSNSVYVCEYQNGVWNNPTCYARNLNYVSDYDVDYIDGQAAVLYAEDADNVSDTQDGTVYVVRNGVKTMIGDASYHVEIVDLCDNIVYFSGNHKVYKAWGSQFSVIDDTGIETDNFSVMKSASGSEAVMFCKQDGFVRDVYVSYQRNGVYTSPVPIISNRSKVTNFAPLFHDDGTISIAYNEESILADSAEIYGLTDMVVEKNVKPNVFLVDPELFYDAYEVMPGNTITFSTGVSNFTTEAISSVRVTLTGSRSGEVYTGTQAVDIPVGGQTFVNVSYELPQTIVNEDYTLTVSPIGLKNIDLSNNRSKCELGYNDIAVSDVRIENDTIYGTITNIGYQTAKNVSFTIREDNEENVPFITVLHDKENFEAGERWEFSQKINAAKFEGTGDVKYYLISAETDSLENNYGNNAAVVFSEPTAATGIILDKTTLTLSEKTSAELHAQILPENATFKNAVYTSDANDIAAVDQDGTVYALKEGNAVITAYTLDGAQSAQCEVTVIPSEEKVGAISSRGLELKVKENNVLYVNDESGNIVEGITWSSTDETVVTVDQDGTVTAVGEGIALVVAQKDSFTDVCIVRVSDYVIILEQDSLTINLGDKKQINASVTPSDGVITYTSEDAGIASVSETGLVTGVGIGTTVIHVMVGDVTADCRVTVIDRQGGGDMEDTDGVLPEDIPSDGIIPDGLWIAVMADFDYIGEKIMPDAHVYDSNVRLRAGRDYTISYKNNTNAAKATSAKAPTIIITGKGNYSGKETATFNILPADLSGDDFSMEAFYVKTGKKAQSPVPVIYYMGTKLKHKKDFTITYSNTSGVYATVGEYSATITGMGNYTGTREIKLTAVAKIAKTPSVSIAKASLAGFEKSFSYTGKAHKQECTLSVKTPEGEKTLTEGVDYTVRYTNNTKAGTAAVIYSGKNGYTGKLKKTYKIMPYNIMYDAESKLNYENFFECAYAKGGSKPKPVITYDGRKLAEGADYTLSYKNNKAVYGKRMPSVIVNGKGNFKGKLELYFTINPQDLSKMTLVSCDKVYQKKAGIYRITPKLMDLDGKLLSAGKDFDKNDLTYIYETAVTLENGVTKQAGDTVEDSDIIPAGTQIRVTFGSGTGDNYTGTFTGVYRIVKADMKSAKVTIPNQTYTGKEITLDKSQITVTLSGTRLKPEDYEIIQYMDNVKKGKAAVTIKGTGNYGGTKTVKFTIGAKGFLWWKKKG